MSGRHSGVSVKGRDCSDYRLDRIEGAAIADPETGYSPVNLVTAMQYGSSANTLDTRGRWVEFAPRTVVSRKYDKLKYGIDIPSLS
jgi:hypothetical protein